MTTRIESLREAYVFAKAREKITSVARYKAQADYKTHADSSYKKTYDTALAVYEHARLEANNAFKVWDTEDTRELHRRLST